ncbi:MAG: ATP-binding cassette domain-containing protein [Candidatus Bathyarchaeia archaeon]
MIEYAIETFNLTKRFRNLTAVDHINIKIRKGEIFGLLGPNGAGKTTTISMLCTILKPTEGTATVNGCDILKEPDNVRRSIGIVFQQPSVDDILTGRENLYLHAMWYGVPKDLRDKRISELLRLVGLESRQHSLVKTYSGGMRRRLELARGLLHLPKVLFLDEPTLGLDPQTRENIWNYIEGMPKMHDITIILTTHYMDEAERLCDRVAIIDEGKIIVMDTPERLKDKVGGDIICLKMRNPDPERFKGISGVTKIEVMEDRLIITLRNSSENLKAILDVAGKVESVEVRPSSLNDVFLSYTGKEIRQESGEGGIAQRIMREMGSR